MSGRKERGPNAASLRLFVAIELDQPLLAELVRVQEQLRRTFPRLRYVRAEGIHCTLKFLGNVGAARMPAVREVLADVRAEAPGELWLDGLGAFNGRKGPRVVWCGLAGDLPRVAAAAAAVDAALARAGFEPERKPFAPHLTLARVPDSSTGADRGRLTDALRHAPPPHPAAMRPREFSLMKSELLPGGSVHTRLASFPFVGG